MEWMIWLGAAISLGGLAGLVWCILQAVRVRREALPEDRMRARLQKLVALNMAALGLSAIGLMLVVIGITLG
ncbi:hypothetical protein C8N32_11743 [Rhodovulum imhoffii]|uniref:Uncharacterized protein n=1 Tax=Rhodovulum imhoffii TaxID=365340 RepID=A0A2T5BPU8_9RHOB|nr:hypothetical protein [Rhodovulum imhoffii]MBK5934179.1 hypothetical protein [Rhodovulum imhoffii]PTN01095.1 hypothetical protein C8N32_11743 [Rhodovulum imhoffii]